MKAKPFLKHFIIFIKYTKKNKNLKFPYKNHTIPETFNITFINYSGKILKVKKNNNWIIE